MFAGGNWGLAAASANNAPSPLGINTKQLSNQMLELTKVVNELKDVLIQQVGALDSQRLVPHRRPARKPYTSSRPRSRRRRFSETPSRSARPAVCLAHRRLARQRSSSRRIRRAVKHPSIYLLIKVWVAPRW